MTRNPAASVPLSSVEHLRDIQPMPSARIGWRRYIALGTARECIVEATGFGGRGGWHLIVDGRVLRAFRTKREALQHCQLDVTL